MGKHKHWTPTGMTELHINDDMGQVSVTQIHAYRKHRTRNTDGIKPLVEMKEVCHFSQEAPTGDLVSWVELGAVMSGYVSV